MCHLLGTQQIDTDKYLSDENRKMSYLMPLSSHPGHVTKNIPYSIAYRIRRICWSDELFEIRLTELCTFLLSRGYKKRSIMDFFERARQVPRDKAKKDKEGEQEQSL